jgi:hypothetical protein
MRRKRVPLPLIILTVVACGSRTALIVGEVDDASIPDSGPDARRDSGRDTSIDVPEDTPDDLPMIDTTKPDVPVISDCPDADSTLVYLISSTNDLMSFFPPLLQFKTIGKIMCPNVGNNTPFSMGVDRKGNAFIVFTNFKLYKVSTLTAACSVTSFSPSPKAGFDDFGMGFAGDNMGESLYVAGSPINGGTSAGLATIDTQGMFGFNFINAFNPNSIGRTELTGTGDGRLFGWSPNMQGSGSRLVEIDRTNAKLLAANNLQVGDPNDAFAFAFWGGDFWIFTSVSGPTTVTKYDPGANKESNVTSTNVTIVGAGVSTCAPQQ